MAHLIGNRKDIKVSFSERAEILRLQEEGNLVPLYEYLIGRINEYEISLWEDKFFSDATGEEMTLNHLTCLLRRDLMEHSGVQVSGQVAAKLTSWLLKALVSSCLESGSLELDATKLLSRIGFSSQTPAESFG